MKILVAGGGSGKGIVFDNKTRKETFMKMAEVQAGLGLGVHLASGFTSSQTTVLRWS